MHAKAILIMIVALTVLLGLGFAPPACGQQSPMQQYWTNNYSTFNFPTSSDYQWQVLAKAQPDECFFSVGDPNNLASFIANYPGNLSTGYGPCSLDGKTGQPKVNQAYLWGLTKHGTDLWFGTIANTLCLVMEGLGVISPLQENTVVCEGAGKDLRPPRIFRFDTNQNQLSEMTSLVLAKGSLHADRLESTIGLRSAGSNNGVVILGGISPKGVTMFAFNGKTKQFIDSIVYDGTTVVGGVTLPAYSNIRQWLKINGELYVGVATSTGSGLFGGTGGAILHWIGNTTRPFQFETVGSVQGDPAYLAHFKGRLFVSTWGGPSGSLGTVLYMSPEFDGGKLTTADAGNWTLVWRLSNYEVEPSAGAAGGAIMGFDGWLYFTTMTPPGAQLLQFSQMYPNAPTDTTSMIDNFLGSYRPTEVFRGKNFGSSKQKIELLYGSKLLPKYNPSSNTWSLVPNNLNQSPKWGFAGYNNFFNSYTWWMHKYNGELFIGTFDWSYLLFETLFDQYGSKIPPQVINTARSFEGADMLMLDSSSDTPVAISLDGMGNFSNYGIRTMITANGNMYLGTANPFNLLTNPNSSQYDGKLGGWELIGMWSNDNSSGSDNDDD